MVCYTEGMNGDNRRYLTAVLTLVGTIIGVGVFGVPYALSKVGLLPAIFYFVLLGGVQLLQHLYFTEAAIACQDKLRLVGLVERYLGRGAKPVASLAIIASYWGALLAYMIVGGTFLHVLAGPYLGGDLLAYQVGWAMVMSIVIFFGLDVVAGVAVFATSALIFAMLLIFGIGLPHVRFDHYLPLWQTQNLLLPYGVVLFSLSGLPAILEMEDILGGDHRRYRSAVITGTVLATLLTAGFGFVVWGVTGGATTPAAVTGLQAVIGGPIGIIGAACGFLAVITASLSVGTNLKNTFRLDYKLRNDFSWLLTCGVPFLFLLLGTKNFVSIVSFSGAVFGGVTAVIVALLYVAVTKKHAVRGEKTLGVPVWTAVISIFVLSVGALLEAGEALLKVLH